MELAATISGVGQVLVEEPLALAHGDGERHHPADVGQGRPRRGQQVLADPHDHLPLDEEVVLEDEAVHDLEDGAFDGVLDGDEAEVDLARGDRPQHQGHRRVGHQVARGQVGLAEQRLLAEGAVGSEEADPGRGGRGGHARTIMAPVDEPTLRNLLEDVRSGVLSADDAVARLRRLPFADLGFARVDHHRALRQGFGEAVYGPGKTPEHCAAIVEELLAGGGSPVILTRADDAQAEAAMAANPGCVRTATTLVWRPRLLRPGRVLVLTAGTADLPVAAECVATLRGHGFDPVLVSDVGVAGVHRLLATADELAAADAVVVVAGMEGALASLVGGMTPAPVVAVPTSVGYGASLEGVTALLAMLSSCASGLTVVGIDNGFGAACAVVRLLPA